MSQEDNLPFDVAIIQRIILELSDKYSFRVEMSSSQMAGAVLATSGFAIAGSLNGRCYGGKLGVAVGGAVGGAYGAGLTAVAFREIWEQMKPQLSLLYEVVYEYVSAMNVEDYQGALDLLSSNTFHSDLLAMIIRNSAAAILGKNIISSLAL